MAVIKKVIVDVLFLVFASGAMAAVWKVPEVQNTIQTMIDDQRVVNGDTVSVWVHTVPPDTYYENVFCRYKDLFIVNRSFLRDGGTGYDSSWDHVIIDGSNQVGSVVTMTGSESAVPRVVLKGFTIRGGRNVFGGGIYCEDVVAFIEKSYVHDCAAGLAGTKWS